MPVVLLSRWGLAPVVVVDDENPSRASSEEEGEDPDDEVTGRTLWDCTQVLWDLVADPDPQNVFTVRGKHVIELGAGTGALSVGLSRAGAASVTCTDLPCHLARIARTVEANTRSSSCCRDGPESSSSGDVLGGDMLVAGGDKPVALSPPPVVVQGLRWGDEGDLASVCAERKRIGTTKHTSSSGSSNNASCCHTGALPSSGGSSTSTTEPPPDGCTAPEATAAAVLDDAPSALFDVIVLSEVLYWPALDLLQEDTREPLRRTLLGLSKPGAKVILIYKERWPQREKGFLESCEGSFEVRDIPASLLALPVSTSEDASSSAIRAVVMTRVSPTRG